VPDEGVLRRAAGGNAVLVTEDKDLGELADRRGLAHAAVLLVRVEGLDNVAKAEVVTQAVRDNEAELPGAFAVVSADPVRLRSPGTPYAGCTVRRSGPGRPGE
jgi:predicted nuclease of predicted toxin-antitoxin system